MSQDLTTVTRSSMAVAPQYKKRTFDEQEVATLRATFGKQLDPLEFKVYIATASHLNLDPFGREIYCLKYGSHPMTLITSIGGYRKMSSRSGRYLGLTEGEFLVRTEEGKTVTVKHRELDPDNVTIISATIGIRVDGFPEPVYATALYKSCVKKVQGQPTENWKIMPDVMLMKCAEAAAHRRAALFPDGAAAVFVEEEINRYGGDTIDVKPTPATAAITAAPTKTEEPTPAKKTRARKTQEAAPTPEPETETSDATETEESVFKNPEMAVMLARYDDFLHTMDITPEGVAFAHERICQKFGVENEMDLTVEVQTVRDFCKGDLLKELREENFLPMPR